MPGQGHAVLLAVIGYFFLQDLRVDHRPGFPVKAAHGEPFLNTDLGRGQPLIEGCVEKEFKRCLEPQCVDHRLGQRDDGVIDPVDGRRNFAKGRVRIRHDIQYMIFAVIIYKGIDPRSADDSGHCQFYEFSSIPQNQRLSPGYFAGLIFPSLIHMRDCDRCQSLLKNCRICALMISGCSIIKR